MNSSSTFRLGVFFSSLLLVPICTPAQTASPDACGPADSAYVRSANQTGGVPLFLQRSEAAKAFHLVKEASRDNMSTVLWATGRLNGPGQTFVIPIDSVTTRITFVLSANLRGTKLALKNPSGDLITSTSEKTENTDLNCGRIVTVSSPAPGNWKAEITGTGMFWLQAQAQSDIHFIRAEFVRVGGRPGHEGAFRIDGQPLAGTPATLQVVISAQETQSAEFHAVNERGDRIEELQLHPSSENREWREFEGAVHLPEVPFRLAAVGLDSSGYKYQRFFSGLFHAENVEVLSTLESKDLIPGRTKTIAFTIHNIGATREYRITVTDAHHYVAKIEPAELALRAGDSAVVRVEIAPPASAKPGTGDDLVVVANSISGSPTSNSSVVHLTVAAPVGPKEQHY